LGADRCGQGRGVDTVLCHGATLRGGGVRLREVSLVACAVLGDTAAR
jgi:hypothetical protein